MSDEAQVIPKKGQFYQLPDGVKRKVLGVVHGRDSHVLMLNPENNRRTRVALQRFQVSTSPAQRYVKVEL